MKPKIPASAAMMFEDEKSGKLGRVKTLLEKRAWTTATAADGESKGEEQAFPVSENLPLGSPPQLPVPNPNQTSVTEKKGSGAASDASHEQVTVAQDVLPNEPRIDEPICDETPEESPDTTHVEQRPVYTTDEEIVVEPAVADATLPAAVRPSSKQGTDDIKVNEPRPIETFAPYAAGFSAANPLSPLHVFGDTHEDSPKAASSTSLSAFPGALMRPASAFPSLSGNSSTNRPSSASAAAQSASVAQASGKRNESGQGTQEKQLGSFNKRKIDVSSDEAPKKQKAGPAGPPGFNTKPVEMRNPVSGVVEKTFHNAAEAAKANYINVTKLMEICRHGGGLIGTHLFRYVELVDVDKVLVTRASKSAREARIEPIPDGPISNTRSTHRPAPTIPLVTRHNSNSNNNTTNNNKKADEVLNIKKVGPSNKVSVAPSHNKKNTRVLPLESGRLTLQEAASRPTATAAKVTTGRPQKPLPDPFDLSTLLPIRRNLKPPLKPKHTIELVELRTLKALVCFRGTTDASRALGLDRKSISGACENYAKARPITFGTYTLRYAQAGHYSAYVYGDDGKDYMKHRKETHAETAARFKRIFEANQKDGTLGTRPVIKPEKVPDVTEDFAMEEEVEISSVDGGLDAFTLCLVCQEVPPSIVFEPCYHAVVCRACAVIACKSFCPACHTRIRRRVEPTMAILVRPRIFSAYSFM